MNEFIWPARVYYEDTDGGNVVYHANYLKFMERARTEWLRHLGFEHRMIQQQYQLAFVVRQIQLSYLKPALLDQLLQVITQINKLGKASLIFGQQVVHQQTVLCTAVVKIAVIDLSTRRPHPFPDPVFKALQGIL